MDLKENTKRDRINMMSLKFVTNMVISLVLIRAMLHTFSQTLKFIVYTVGKNLYTAHSVKKEYGKIKDIPYKKNMDKTRILHIPYKKEYGNNVSK